MKSIITLIALMVGVQVSGQHIVTLKGGAGWTMPDPGNKAKLATGAASAAYGVGYSYALKKGLFFTSGAQMEQRNYKHDYSISSSYPNRYHQKFEYNYLTIPIGIGYAFKGKISPWGSIGILNSFLTKARGYTDFKPQFGEVDPNIENLTRKFDLSGYAELGVSMRVAHHISAGVSYRATGSFKAFSTYDSDLPKHRTSTVFVNISYSF